MGRTKKKKKRSASGVAAESTRHGPLGEPKSNGKRTLAILALLGIVATAAAWMSGPSIIASYWASQGESALLSRELTKANGFFDRAREWNKRDGAFALRKARIARLNADAESTRNWIQVASDEGAPRRECRREETLLKVQGGRASELIEELPSLIGVQEQDATTVFEAYAVGFSAVGDYQTAIELLDRWIAIEPDNGIAYFRKGQILFDQESFQQAEALLIKALQLEPKLLDARLSLAQTAYALEKNDQALHYYQQIVRLDPTNVDAHLSAASMLMRFKKTEQAVTEFKAVLVVEPKNFTARLELGSHYAKNGMPESVISVIGPLMADYPDDVALNYLMATAHDQLGNKEPYEACLRRYLHGRSELDRLVELQQYANQDPSNFRLRKELGLGFLRLEWGAADRWLNEAVSINPRDSALYEGLSELARKRGDDVQAEKYRAAATLLRQQESVKSSGVSH